MGWSQILEEAVEEQDGGVEDGGTLAAEASSGPASWERQVAFSQFLVNVVAAATFTIQMWRRKFLWRFCIKGDFPVLVCNCCKAFY